MKKPKNFPADEMVTEQSYLVARGVRHLAIVGHIDADPLVMLQVATKIEALADPSSLPFVINRGDGKADYGYAAEKWVVDLYEWIIRQNENAVPLLQRHRILGLLLGYSASAIADFEARLGSRRFS